MNTIPQPEHLGAPPSKLLTGDLLRRLFEESPVPASDMRTAEEVASWWKHYAGRVRNALNGAIVAADDSQLHCTEPHPGLGSVPAPSCC